jgi:hypothetical protein
LIIGLAPIKTGPGDAFKKARYHTLFSGKLQSKAAARPTIAVKDDNKVPGCTA